MRSRLIQATLTVIFLVLLIQVVLVAPNQIRDAEQQASLLPLPPTRPPRADVDQSMNGMHMIETNEGRKDWELWSDRALSLKTKEILELEKVKAIFFSNNGVTFTVTGARGTVQVKKKDLHIEGDVVTRSSNGYTFRTGSLDYDSLNRMMKTADNVEMSGPRDASGTALYLNGVGMEASLEESTMHVLRDVRSQKTLADGKKAIIRSQSARFSAKGRSAYFMGDVVLDVDSMRMTGPEAKFEYDSDSDALKTVVFSGGARVSDSDKWATAQNVRVDFEKNRFIFRGNPRVVQNNDELRGDEIIFLDGGKQVQVRGARAKVDEKRLEKVN